ncbi:hypothetical protein GCM10009657_19550 [Oryzihumus leptocrescens]
MGSARAPVASSGTWPAWTCRVSKDQFGVVSVIGFPCLSALLTYDEWSRKVRGAPHARCGDTNKGVSALALRRPVAHRLVLTRGTPPRWRVAGQRAGAWR